MDDKPLIPGIGRGKTSTGLVRCAFLLFFCLHAYRLFRVWRVKVVLIILSAGSVENSCILG